MPYKSKIKQQACQKIGMKRYREKCFANGLCWKCNRSPFEDGKKCCRECLDKKLKDHIQRKEKRLKEGLCRFCGKSPFESSNSKSCIECYLKNKAQSYFGAKSRWKELLNLMTNQNNQCPYTGIKLKIAVNASLDHIVPKSSKGNEDIANLQWVYFGDDFDVNMMKRDFSHDNFLKAIKIMYGHLNKV